MSIERKPDAERRRAVLEERARQLAKPLPRSSDERRDRFAVLRIGREHFAFPATSLVEIGRLPPVAPLPGLPPWLVGVAQLHGEPFAMLDISLLLDKGPTLRAEVVAVLESSGRSLGVLADEVIGLRDLGQGDLAPWLGSSDAVVSAITRELVVLVDVERLFSDPRVVVDDTRGVS